MLYRTWLSSQNSINFQRLSIEEGQKILTTPRKLNDVEYRSSKAKNAQKIYDWYPRSVEFRNNTDNCSCISKFGFRLQTVSSNGKISV